MSGSDPQLDQAIRLQPSMAALQQSMFERRTHARQFACDGQRSGAVASHCTPHLESPPCLPSVHSKSRLVGHAPARTRPARCCWRPSAFSKLGRLSSVSSQAMLKKPSSVGACVKMPSSSLRSCSASDSSGTPGARHRTANRHSHGREQRVEKARQTLLAAELRLQSLQKLVERKQQEQALAQMRREQKQTDERASLRLSIHPSDPAGRRKPGGCLMESVQTSSQRSPAAAQSVHMHQGCRQSCGSRWLEPHSRPRPAGCLCCTLGALGEGDSLVPGQEPRRHQRPQRWR